MIGLVALVVFGPERLPGLARSAGFWVGRARRTVSDLKQEFKQELHNADIMAREEELQQTFDQRASEYLETETQVDRIAPSYRALSAHRREGHTDDKK